MRIRQYVHDSIGAADRLAMSIRALAAAITELARAVRETRR